MVQPQKPESVSWHVAWQGPTAQSMPTSHTPPEQAPSMQRVWKVHGLKSLHGSVQSL
jgi:hypothetical protein